MLTTTPATRVQLFTDGTVAFDGPGDYHAEYVPPVERMDPPDPANVGMADRLMTHQRMLDLVGDKMVRFQLVSTGSTLAGFQPALDLYIDCAECGKGITAARPTSPVQFCADVLRHYVNVHGLPLSGAAPDGGSGHGG